MDWLFGLKWAKVLAVYQAIAERLPLVLVGLIAIALFSVAGRLVRTITRHALRHQDPSLALMVSGLANFVSVIFGVLVALWIILPTINFREIFAGLGVTGLILGFALKDIIENFVGG